MPSGDFDLIITNQRQAGEIENLRSDVKMWREVAEQVQSMLNDKTRIVAWVDNYLLPSYDSICRTMENQTEIIANQREELDRRPTDWAWTQACRALDKHHDNRRAMEARIAELEALAEPRKLEETVMAHATTAENIKTIRGWMDAAQWHLQSRCLHEGASRYVIRSDIGLEPVVDFYCYQCDKNWIE